MVEAQSHKAALVLWAMKWREELKTTNGCAIDSKMLLFD